MASMRNGLLVVLLLALAACDDAETPDDGRTDAAPPADGAVRDARGDDVGAADADAPDTRVAADAAATDAAATDASDASEDAGPDAASDMGPPAPDAGPPAPDMGPPVPDAGPPAPPLDLPFAAAVADGPHDRLGDDAALLDPGASLDWDVALPPELAAGGAFVVALDARVWRAEDGHVDLEWGGETFPARLRGDGDRGWTLAVAPPDAPRPVGLDGPPPAVRLPAGAGRLRVVARGGTVELGAARLLDPRDVPPANAPAAPPPPAGAVDVAPCGEPGCDDAPALAARIADAPPGPLTLRLAAGRFTLRTPLVIRRDDVRLEGAAEGTEVAWVPAAGGDQSAVIFAGRGPSGPAVALPGDVAAGARRFTVQAPADWRPAWVRFVADDFGDVPAQCAEGRDVERFFRHLSQPARVLAVTPHEGGVEVVLDRPVNLDVPAAARPRLEPLTLLRGATVERVRFVADCAAAEAGPRIRAADCATPEVADDDALVFRWTDGAWANDVTARYFGRFSVYVDHALETRVAGYAMSWPSNYGEGGRGYGVHTVTAARTIVRAPRIAHARHAVVVDFGSSDTQVLDGEMTDTTLAIVDIHGESSRDTWVRGNTLARGQVGVIVGGGGTEVHCNDGPRHHLDDNRVTATGGAAVAIMNATRDVFLEGNDLDEGLTLLLLALGTGDVDARHNRFGASTGPPVTVAAEAGPLRLWRNRFDRACTPEAAAPRLAPSSEIEQIDNAYCP